MVVSENSTRHLNPCLLHLQKMGLELKCPLCLDLLNQPLLLPCNHIFCSPCLTKLVELDLNCPVCKLRYQCQDLRSALNIENIVNIYKSMDAAFGANYFQSMRQADLPDDLKHSLHSPVASDISIGQKSRGDIQRNVCRKDYFPSLPGKSQDLFSPHPAQGQFGTGSRGQLSKDGGSQERDMDQLEQTSPSSPPSFGNIKDSDDDNNDQGNEQSSEGLFPKPLKNNQTEKGTMGELKSLFPLTPKMDPSTAEGDFLRKLEVYKNQRPILREEQDHTRESKRQKKSNCGLHDMMEPSSNSGHKNVNPTVVCAFCQSSTDTEASGPMLHYDNGNPLVADQATHSSVIHVHKKCIEWAPQVYFDGETAKNLEAEVARGAKIKCSSCGKKGAALGCYARSCKRSYHVPCAVEIEETRWDCDNFLMLCAVHSSFKLPNERSKSTKKTKTSNPLTKLFNGQSLRENPSSTLQQAFKLWTSPPGASSEWVLCGSALSVEDKDLMDEFAILTGATVKKSWNPSVTHVIASTDDIGACSRTMKMLMGILNGRWILKTDWIKACMEANHPVDEEPYEICCDIYGCRDGPKNGRVRVMEKAPKLFSSICFYFSGDFVPSYKGYLEELVAAAGGTVLGKKVMLVSQDSEESTINVVVYNLEVPERYKTGELSSIVEQRRKEAETFAAQTSFQVAGHTWILDSIAACKLQPLAL